MNAAYNKKYIAIAVSVVRGLAVFRTNGRSTRMAQVPANPQLYIFPYVVRNAKAQHRYTAT